MFNEIIDYILIKNEVYFVGYSCFGINRDSNYFREFQSLSNSCYLIVVSTLFAKIFQNII